MNFRSVLAQFGILFPGWLGSPTGLGSQFSRFLPPFLLAATLRSGWCGRFRVFWCGKGCVRGRGGGASMKCFVE
uniref:Putative secreted protein n=1 Tax=Anopheles darlingi TaxID=43151 RepID=A0A2M4DB92_ANODA